MITNSYTTDLLYTILNNHCPNVQCPSSNVRYPLSVIRCLCPVAIQCHSIETIFTNYGPLCQEEIRAENTIAFHPPVLA